MTWRRDWTEKEISLLTVGCGLLLPMDFIAEQIKRDVDECLEKAKELKLQVSIDNHPEAPC